MGMSNAAAASRANAMSAGMAASQGSMMGSAQSQVRNKPIKFTQSYRHKSHHQNPLVKISNKYLSTSNHTSNSSHCCTALFDYLCM